MNDKSQSYLSEEFKKINAELTKFSNYSKNDFAELQIKLFKRAFDFHYNNNPAYRKIIDEHCSKPKIKTLDDLVRLPVIGKEEIIQNHPFISVPPETLRACYQTSGTTGESKYIYLNENDMNTAAKIKAMGFLLGGAKEGDRLLAAMLCGPWAGGMITREAGLYLGLTISADTKIDIKEHIKLIEKHKTNYIVCLPAYLPKFYETVLELQKDPKRLGIERIFICGDMYNERFRQHFSERLGTDIFDLYCSTEFSCIAAECKEKNLHYWADQFLLEVLDPKTKQPVKPGERGELVITCIKKQTMPLIRYNTHDVAFLHENECDCGVGFPIMSHILGRSDNMISLSAACVYPDQIEDAMAKSDIDIYNFIVEKIDYKDKIIIKAEVKGEKTESLKDLILSNIFKMAPEVNFVINQSQTMHRPEVILFDKGALFNGVGKIKKIYDLREKRKS